MRESPDRPSDDVGESGSVVCSHTSWSFRFHPGARRAVRRPYSAAAGRPPRWSRRRL